MTELERQVAIEAAIHYWLPISWPESGYRYTVTGFVLTGDAETGGVDLSVSRDSEVAVIQFTNDECYGETPLTPSAAKQRVYDGTYA
jgi:hypothetical protein